MVHYLIFRSLNFILLPHYRGNHLVAFDNADVIVCLVLMRCTDLFRDLLLAGASLAGAICFLLFIACVRASLEGAIWVISVEFLR